MPLLHTLLRRRSALLRSTRSSSSCATAASSDGGEAAASDAQTPSQVYASLMAQGGVTHDRAQAHVLKKYLDKLHTQLRGYALPVWEEYEATDGDHAATEPKQQRADAEEATKPQAITPSPPQVLVPRGLYLHGSVGTGKSMLMDLFFANVDAKQKRRVHFNKFMLEVHERIQAHKQHQLATFGRQRNIDLDPKKDGITRVAEQIADESHVLCFDEFQVTDIADALIMRKLFGVFFRKGVVMIATSNTPPSGLYRDGTNREYFLPFLDQLARHTKVVEINSDVDYRMLLSSSSSNEGDGRDRKLFLYPLNDAMNAQLEAKYQELLKSNGFDAKEEKLRIPVMMGRHLDVRGARNGVCRITFDELCNTEKGAADYKALCECFSAVVLEGVPSLNMEQHDQARRFILLIDELYEHRTKLLSSSAVPTHQVFNFDDASIEQQAYVPEDAAKLKNAQLEASLAQGIPAASSWDGPVGAYNPAKMAGLQVQNLCALQDLKVAFKRAVSRLQEMQSDKYLQQNEELRATRQKHLQHVLQ
uniref:AAA+ ATPase domain-containing protein n=1 Tax=Globisporangium ultimum (strain ATCC 200006 / CBS 805.95 / DAOM BR144) TaxID=431595 RepID=K3WP45_GLOUD